MTTKQTVARTFEREERYIVFKKSHLTQQQLETLDKMRTPPTIPPANWHDDHTMPTVECVVVEADWPEYEPVWSMIKARMQGRDMGDDERFIAAAIDFSEAGPDRFKPGFDQYRDLALAASRLAARHHITDGGREGFLTTYVSEDAKIIGIEHDTDADWQKVHDAHVALRDRLNVRIAERNKCPHKPVALAQPLEAGEDELPDDVRRLVIAARTIAFNDWDGDSEEWVVARKELDDASEAFASRVPWDDEPISESDGAD